MLGGILVRRLPRAVPFRALMAAVRRSPRRLEVPADSPRECSQRCKIWRDETKTSIDLGLEFEKASEGVLPNLDLAKGT